MDAEATMNKREPRPVLKIILTVFETGDYAEEQIRRDVRRLVGARGAITRLLGHTYLLDVAPPGGRLQGDTQTEAR